MTGRAMGSHQSARSLTTTWLTPLGIIDALGPFDLDPCGFPGWPTACRIISDRARGLGESRRAAACVVVARVDDDAYTVAAPRFDISREDLAVVLGALASRLPMMTDECEE